MSQLNKGPVLPIDMHVHIVGNGLTGSGCWLRIKGFHRPMAAFMLKHIRLANCGLAHPDFDHRYVAHLAGLVRESSLGAIVVLAQDQVYDDAGKLMQNAGSFYVPNDYVLRLSREYQQFLPAV